MLLIPSALLRVPTAATLFALCTAHADPKTGEITLRSSEMAAALNISQPTLRRARRILEQEGWMVLRGPEGLQRWFMTAVVPVMPEGAWAS